MGSILPNGKIGNFGVILPGKCWVIAQAKITDFRDFWTSYNRFFAKNDKNRQNKHKMLILTIFVIFGEKSIVARPKIGLLSIWRRLSGVKFDANLTPKLAPILALKLGGDLRRQSQVLHIWGGWRPLSALIAAQISSHFRHFHPFNFSSFFSFISFHFLHFIFIIYENPDFQKFGRTPRKFKIFARKSARKSRDTASFAIFARVMRNFRD